MKTRWWLGGICLYLGRTGEYMQGPSVQKWKLCRRGRGGVTKRQLQAGQVGLRAERGCPGNTRCELQSQAEAVNLSSSAHSAGFGKSPGCAVVRGGTCDLISSWLRQSRALDLEWQGNVIQAPAASVCKQLPLTLCSKELKALPGINGQGLEDWLAMPVLGAELVGIVGSPQVCWDWVGASQGYSKERGCREVIPASEDRFTSTDAKWNNL